MITKTGSASSVPLWSFADRAALNMTSQRPLKPSRLQQGTARRKAPRGVALYQYEPKTE